MSRLESTAEKNARVAARGEYLRWLAKRFGDLDLLLTLQGEDRVSLRKVYVPLRLGTEDRSDESMGDPANMGKETLPGHDALDLIAQQPFVAISGRPGSGKTTLVQAIVGELAGEAPSDFRKRLVGNRGILPIPLILRDYQDELPTIESLGQLLDCWWAKAEGEARDKGFRLDPERLRQSYAQDGDAIPLLLIFDGMDEAGGPELRTRLLRIALQAAPRRFRVVVTGRPAGFQDLFSNGAGLDEFDHLVLGLGRGPIEVAEVSPESGRRLLAMFSGLFSAQIPDPPRPSPGLYALQPLASPQIRDFLEGFFRLRQEWQVERERLAAEFGSALGDPQRPHLLNLARRPIFLTLMALVHANDRRLPHGRADLYRRIVDLYLVRQTQQRRLNQTVKGEPMPHWDEREVRRALGYLAWRSQHRGSAAVESKQRDARQVIWSREELETELKTLLGGQDPDLGRFADLKPQDAGRLLDYFLHPTGLLVDPAEGRYQFAHLSFQEYLCAEYILGRAKAMGTRRFLDSIRNLLYGHLGLPGWDEVGLLLLCIHAAEGAQAEQTAHLELLAELDPAELPQARLLIAALTGRELDFAPSELARWLPIAVAAALVQPKAHLADAFRKVADWQGPGLDLLRRLFQAEDPMPVLAERIAADPPGGREPEEWARAPLPESLRQRWGSPRSDAGWDAPFGPEEARAQALLALANDSGWLPADPRDPDRRPIADAHLERSITDWLAGILARAPEFLYRRETEEGRRPGLPVITDAGVELDRLVPDQGPLWGLVSGSLPLDLWLLQGESADPQAAVVLTLDPGESPLARGRTALGLCQAIVLVESMAQGPAVLALFRDLSRWQPLNLWQSRWLWRLRSRTRTLDLSRFLSRHLSLARALCELLSESRPLAPGTRRALARTAERIERVPNSDSKRVTRPLESFGYRHAAFDWFEEQAADPDLMRRRGLRPGEPLPRDLGIFDASGRILERLPRESLVRLRAWLEDDDAVLAWLFPEGLAPEDDRDLREQLHILHHHPRSDGGRGQPWSPIAHLDAALADWPEKQPVREVTLAAAERDLLAVLNGLFPEDDPSGR